ncbi:MAG: DUF167 domain-containing protein [Gammaproteobacteria bacterium]|nr:DUF167 domain-containing protein [Gammaproteobacteria bacterium]
MSEEAPWSLERDDLLLRLKVQPRAKETAWAGRFGDALKVRLAATPVDGKANAALLRWLAGEFGVPVGQVTLERGSNTRLKRVRIKSPARYPSCIEQT